MNLRGGEANSQIRSSSLQSQNIAQLIRSKDQFKFSSSKLNQIYSQMTVKPQKNIERLLQKQREPTPELFVREKQSVPSKTRMSQVGNDQSQILNKVRVNSSYLNGTIQKSNLSVSSYSQSNNLSQIKQVPISLSLSQAVFLQIDNVLNKSQSKTSMSSSRSQLNMSNQDTSSRNYSSRQLIHKHQENNKKGETKGFLDKYFSVKQTSNNLLMNDWGRSESKSSSIARLIYSLPFQEYQYFMSWTHFSNQNLIEHITFKFSEQMQKIYPFDSTFYFSQLYRESFKQNYKSLNHCKQFKSAFLGKTKPKVYQLPPLDEKRYRGTLIFDMDETLIHCNETVDMHADFITKVNFITGECIEVRISIRPHLEETLDLLSQFFEIIIFTASHESYANKVLDMIDPKKKYFAHRFYRHNCFFAEDGLLIKDLRIIGNRDLRKMVLIDNASYSYAFQVGNGIPILPYYDNKQDKELLWLTNYLCNLKGDFTKQNRKTFKLHLYQEGMSLDEALIMLFQEEILI